MLVRRGECRDFGDEGSEVTGWPEAGSSSLINGFVIIPNTIVLKRTTVMVLVIIIALPCS
jgi:hypothetical protein